MDGGISRLAVGILALGCLLHSGCASPDATQSLSQKPPADGAQEVHRIPPLVKLPEANRDTRKSPAKQPPEKKSGPTFPGEPEKQPGVALAVTAPRRAHIGGGALFRLLIRNDGSRPTDKLEVECRLGTGLEFSGRREKTFHQNIGVLAPGQSHPLALLLKPTQGGKLCAEFSLTSGSRELLWKSVCVEAVAPVYVLDVFVPPMRTVGALAEATVVLANRSDRDLKNVRLNVNFDPDKLKLKIATRGSKQASGQLTWPVGNLKAGDTFPLQTTFETLKSLERCCISVEVTADGAPSEFRSDCLKVVSPTGPFDMRLLDTTDLLQPGDETAIIIGVKNRTPNRANGDPLIVTIPDNYRVISLSAWRGTKKLALKPTLADGRITFPAPGPLDPYTDVVYRVCLKSLRPGRSTCSAELRSRDQPPLKLVEPMTVLR